MSEVAVQQQPQTNSAVEGAVAPETKPQEQKSDPRFVQLARKERMLREQQRDLKMKEEMLKTREMAFESGYIKKEDIQKDTLGALKNLGIDYDKLTQDQLINLQSQDPIAAELARQRQVTEELQAKLDGFEKSNAETQTQSYAQALNQISREVKQMVDTDERYEAIKATGSYQDVVKFIETYFKKTNEIIDYAEAADFIENDIIDDSVKRAQLKKVQAKLTPTQQAAQGEIKVPGFKRDLSNKITITPKDYSKAQTTLTNQIPNTTKPLTPRERAILAGKGLLK